MDSSLEREKSIEYLKQETKKQFCPNDCFVLFHCLNELNDHSLINEIQSYMTCGKQNMPPDLWPALTYILVTSDERTEEFTLQKYGRSDDTIERLHPVIKLSTKARWALFGILLNVCLYRIIHIQGNKQTNNVYIYICILTGWMTVISQIKVVHFWLQFLHHNPMWERWTWETTVCRTQE